MLAFGGTGVALITPFRADKSIDYPALGGLIDYVIEGGVDYIVCLGTTGEAITLSSQECREILDFTIRHVDERVPIVAGFFGGNYTQRLVSVIEEYNFDGVAGIMSSSPAYSKPPQEGIYQHFMRIAEVAPRPLIIYNVPGRTSSNVLPRPSCRLAEESDRFAAVKEASGILFQATEILRHRPDHLAVLCGDDPLATAMIAVGGHGAISVIANALPGHFSRMVAAALENRIGEARRLNFAMHDVHPLLYCEGNPVGYQSCRKSTRTVPQSSTGAARSPIRAPPRATTQVTLARVPGLDL